MTKRPRQFNPLKIKIPFDNVFFAIKKSIIYSYVKMYRSFLASAAKVYFRVGMLSNEFRVVRGQFSLPSIMYRIKNNVLSTLKLRFVVSITGPLHSK